MIKISLHTKLLTLYVISFVSLCYAVQTKEVGIYYTTVPRTKETVQFNCHARFISPGVTVGSGATFLSQGLITEAESSIRTLSGVSAPSSYHHSRNHAVSSAAKVVLNAVDSKMLLCWEKEIAKYKNEYEEIRSQNSYVEDALKFKEGLQQLSEAYLHKMVQRLTQDKEALEIQMGSAERERQRILKDQGITLSETFGDVSVNIPNFPLNLKHIERSLWVNQIEMEKIRTKILRKELCLEYTRQQLQFLTTQKIQVAQSSVDTKQIVDTCAHMQKSYKGIEGVLTGDSIDKQRCASLNEVVTSKNVQSVIVIEFSREAQELLKSCKINIDHITTKFYGNAFHKQLTSEIANILDRSGRIYLSSKDASIRSYVENTARTCEVAIQAIQNGTPRQAMAWVDLAYVSEIAVGIARGTARGIIRGVEDFGKGIAHIIEHPQEFIEQCNNTIRVCFGLDDISQDENGRWLIKDTRLEKLKAVYKQFMQLPFEKRVENGIALLTSFIIPMPKLSMIADCAKALAYMQKVVKIEAIGLQNLLRIERMNARIIKGVPVAQHYVPLIEQLVKTGRIAQADDVRRAVRFLEAPLGTVMTESMSKIMNELEGVLLKEELARKTASALSEVAKTAEASQTQRLTRIAAVALTAASMASTSFGTSALMESAKKSIISSSIAQTATSAMGDASQMAKSTLGTTSEGVVSTSLTSAISSTSATVASETKAFAATQRAAQETLGSSSTVKTVATEVTEASAKISKEEAVRSMQSSRRVLTEVEVKAITEAAKEASEGCKNIVITEGERRVGEIAQVPIEAPTNKGFWHHVFRAWKKKRDIKGCHMPAQRQPELISEVTGSNALGIKEVTLKMGKATASGKTIAPSHWNLVDYANHCKEAYSYVKKTEEVREGVLKLTGIDKSGITWEMFLELKEGKYALTTAYPTLEIIGL